MAKHTQGPWEADFSKKYYAKPCVRHNGMIVCYLPEQAIGMNGEDERRADAALICAAPELLAACEEIEATAQNLKLDATMRAAVDACYAAIKKARGEK